MNVGIVRYPGSNCDFDAKRYFQGKFIWHKEEDINCLDNINLLVIPGGFAFGDRIYEKATGKYSISPGAMAISSNVTNIILEANRRKIPILGICNGFQILIKLGLLPGELVENKDKKFHSFLVDCVFQDDSVCKIPIANMYGRYISDGIPEEQIFLKYKGYDTTIAGIRNKDSTVFGMMPHPERVPNNDFIKNKILILLGIYENYEKIDPMSILTIMNSEHVSYKSTKKFLKNLYTSGNHVIQGPGENAGIIDIGDGYALCMRIESHNHPIFINPFQGAATGVGGILRDIFTMGARPIALFDFLRFGTDQRADVIEKETINGISYYGNCVGVPVMGGQYYRNEVYNKNPLLNVACLGLVKKDNIIYGNALNPGSLLMYIGSKTGIEGVGGADMASKQFSGDISDLESSIQTGDPFLEKLLLEVCCEIAELKLAEGMQDMGAGGLMCSSLELIVRGRKKTGKNLGCEIDINRVPRKEKMSDTDVLISESQERMLLVCTPENASKIERICNEWDLENSLIGLVTENGDYKVTASNNEIFNNKIDNFVDIQQDWERKCTDYSIVKKTKTNTMKWSQYDNTLGGRTIKGPLEPGSYSIIDIHEIKKKLYVTWGNSFDECMNKMSNFKAEKISVVNCLNFGHPEDSIGDFEDIVNKLADDCKNNKVPVVGGNVSLYNTTDGISIPPSPTILMIGVEKI